MERGGDGMLVMLKLKEMSESDMLNVEDTGLIGKDQKNCIHVLSGRALGGGWMRDGE